VPVVTRVVPTNGPLPSHALRTAGRNAAWFITPPLNSPGVAPRPSCIGILWQASQDSDIGICGFPAADTSARSALASPREYPRRISHRERQRRTTGASRMTDRAALLIPRVHRCRNEAAGLCRSRKRASRMWPPETCERAPNDTWYGTVTGRAGFQVLRVLADRVDVVMALRARAGITLACAKCVPWNVDVVWQVSQAAARYMVGRHGRRPTSGCPGCDRSRTASRCR